MPGGKVLLVHSFLSIYTKPAFPGGKLNLLQSSYAMVTLPKSSLLGGRAASF